VALFADLSTTNVATDKQQVSHLASAGSLSPSDNICTKLKLSFAIDSIQMELFTGDRDVVNVVITVLNTYPVHTVSHYECYQTALFTSSLTIAKRAS